MTLALNAILVYIVVAKWNILNYKINFQLKKRQRNIQKRNAAIDREVEAICPSGRRE